jgi:hypothetical protein
VAASPTLRWLLMALMETLIKSRGSCYLSLHRWRKKSSWTMLSWDNEGIPVGSRRRSRRSCDISGRRNRCHCSLPYPPATPDHQIQSSRKSADTTNNLAPKLTPSKNYVCLSVCLCDKHQSQSSREPNCHKILVMIPRPNTTNLLF